MMEKLDLRYYLFHAIEPIEYPKINRESYEKLHCFLETGYIYPGNQVNKNIPKKYQDIVYGSKSPYVFLALTENNNLNPDIASRGGEFSAFGEEIEGKLAFMFDEDILKNNEVVSFTSILSNEVHLASKVPLSMAKAIYCPKNSFAYFIDCYREVLEESSSFSSSIFKELTRERKQELREQISSIINDPNPYLTKVYQPLDEIREILAKYEFSLPLVSRTGYILDKEKESTYIENHYEEVKELIKK